MLPPAVLRVLKAVGWTGVVGCVAAAATFLVLGNWVFASALAVMAVTWLWMAYIDRAANWLTGHRRIGNGAAVVMIGTAGAAVLGTIGAAIWARNWQVAVLLLAQAGPLAMAIPPRERVHASDFRAIAAGVGMDERRHQIRLRARSDSFLFLTILSGVVATISFLVSGMRDASESGWVLPVEDWSVWPPALWLLVICVVLELVAPLRHSRRM